MFNYIPTQEVTADIMTKYLPSVKHRYLDKKLRKGQGGDLKLAKHADTQG